MINYKSLINKIAPFVLATGLTALTTGCNNLDEPKTVESSSYTNELLCLAMDNGSYNKLLYVNQEGQVKWAYGLPMQRDLPDNSKPVVIFKDCERTVHIPSNSTFRVSKNENFHFELELNKDIQKETQ